MQFMSSWCLVMVKSFFKVKADEMQNSSPEEMISWAAESCSCLAGTKALVTTKLAVFLDAPSP